MKARLIVSVGYADHVLDAGSIIEGDEAPRFIAAGLAVPVRDPETASKEPKREIAVAPKAKKPE